VKLIEGFKRKALGEKAGENLYTSPTVNQFPNFTRTTGIYPKISRFFEFSRQIITGNPVGNDKLIK